MERDGQAKSKNHIVKINPLFVGLLVAVILLIGAFSINRARFLNSALSKNNYNSQESLTLQSPTPIQSPAISQNDPNVSCGPGQNSGQFVKDKQSNCKNYVDCGLNGNKSWTLMLNAECTKKQAEGNAKSNSLSNSTNIPQSTYHSLSVVCPTQYGVYTEYGSTYEEAQKYCDDLKKMGPAPNINQNFQPTQQPNQSNVQANQQCKSDAASWYNSQVQSINAQYGGGSSAGPAMIEIAKQQYDQKVSDCDKAYPT